VGGLSAVDSAAQDGAADAGGEAVFTKEHEDKLTRIAVDQLFRFALDAVRVPGDPLAEDFQATSRYIRVLERHAPDYEEMLRLRIAAHRAGGELDEVIRATKVLVGKYPKDTVAQLRILMSSIRSRQDAAGRLALYDRLLGPRGRGLDISIRSRLAFDAALLAREMGDEGVYRDRLLLAAEDRTNKEAAALFATEFLDRAETALERVEILANLVTADPVDAASLQHLAGELMRHGAFEGAQRMWERTSDVLANAEGGLSSHQLFEYHLGIWAMDGAEATLEPLEDVYYAQVLALEQQHQQMDDEGITIDKDEEVLLPQMLETVRLAAYVSLGWTEVEEEEVAEEYGDKEAGEAGDAAGGAEEDGEGAGERLEEKKEKRSPAHASLDRIGKTLDQIYASRDTDDADEDMLRDVRAAMLLELNGLRLWSGLEIDEAEASLAELEDFAASGVIDQESVDRFRGMLAARRGDIETAAELLGPLAAGGDHFARYGICVAEETGGSADRAAGMYREIALDSADTLLGTMARERVVKLTGEVFEYGAVARELDAYVMDFAPWLDRVTESPRNYIDLRVENVRSVLEPLDRMQVDLTITNVSRWPLAMGPGMPIHSRVLLVPSLWVEGRDIRLRDDGTINTQAMEIFKPEVVQLDQRLRLLPGESVKTRVWAGKGGVGRLLDRAISMGATVRWRAVQGFMPTANGGFETGAHCVTSSGDVMRRIAGERVESDEDLSLRFQEAEAHDLPIVMLQAREWLVEVARDPDADQFDVNVNAGTISRALEGRYGEMNDAMKCLVIAFFAPYGFFNNEGAQGIMDLLLEEKSDLVQLAMMANYGPFVPQEYLESIATGDDADLAFLGSLVLSRVGVVEEEEESEQEMDEDRRAALEAAIEAASGGNAPAEDEAEDDGGGL
jgi:hypothetical protein